MPEKFKPIIKDIPDPDLDVVLLVMRIKEGMERLSSLLVGKSAEIVRLALSLMGRQYFLITNRRLGEELSGLSLESEALIDSPDAKSPEKRARRKIVADKINIILQKQIELEKEHGDLREYEAIIKKASFEQLSDAESLIQPLVKELNLIANPPLENN